MMALLPIILFVTTDIYEKVKIEKTKSTVNLQMYCGLHFKFCQIHYYSWNILYNQE
jgi:hypothetical protein